MEASSFKAEDIKLLYFAAKSAEVPVSNKKLATMLGEDVQVNTARMRHTRLFARLEKEFGPLPVVADESGEGTTKDAAAKKGGKKKRKQENVVEKKENENDKGKTKKPKTE